MPRAGLAPASVTEAGAALVDEIGFAQLSMGLLAERLGVKTPSLYKHVASQADLAHRIAVLAMTELADAIRDATQGRAGSDALVAGAQAMRELRATNTPAATPPATPPDRPGPTTRSSRPADRVLDSSRPCCAATSSTPTRRSTPCGCCAASLHGFATLEAAGGFQIDTDVDDSFTWMIAFIDHGLQQSGRRSPPR